MPIMKKRSALFALTFLIIFSAQTMAQDGMSIQKSNYSVQETTDRLERILTEKGLKIFEKVNHQNGAASVGMDLSPSVVLIFGNPKLGTPLMQCAPTVAIDLPQKMLIWENAEGEVQIGYNSADYLKSRHNIEGCTQELQKISGALRNFAQSAAGSN